MKYLVNKIIKNWQKVLLILFCLTPLIWFRGRGGILINGVDTNFPLDPIIWFKRRFFVWNDVANAGINFASSTAGIFFHLIQVIPFSLRANLQTTQIISLIFWFSLVVLSSYIFARKIFPKSRVAQIVFITIYSFNIYLFNTWENIKVANLSLVVSLPLFLSILLAYRDKEISKSRLVFYSVLVSVIASGSGINPAYFIALVIGVVLFALVNGAFSPLVVVLATLFLVNSFWIVSTGRQLFFAGQKVTSLNDIGFANWLNSLSENTSLLNVLRLQGAWDWYAKDDAGGALYIPYATNYFRNFPFVAFSILLTALSLVGFLVAKKSKDRLKIYFGLLLIAGLFLSAGSHLPTGSFYVYLTKSLPFFSFFRSPWYVFCSWVVLALAGLIGLVFDSNKKIVLPLAVIIVLGNLIYTYPLVTGKIFRPGRSDSFYIQFPAYVFEAKDWLSSVSLDGRVIGYPGDEVERFEWGYNGIESILNLLSSQESLFSSLNNPDSGEAKMIQTFYNAVRRGQVEIAESLAAKLNVSTIFVKNDQSSLWDPLPQAMLDYSDAKVFGSWAFYNLPQDELLPKIYSPKKLFYGTPGDNLERVVGFLPADNSVVSDKDTVVKQISNIDLLAGKIIFAQNSQLADYEDYLMSASKQAEGFRDRDLSKVSYTVNLIESGAYQVFLEDLLLEDFGVNWREGLHVVVDGREQTWQAKKLGNHLVFESINFSKGQHKILINLRSENLLDIDEQMFVLTNRDETEKWLSFRVSPFSGMYPYLVGFDYKNIYGMESIFKAEQKGEGVNYKFQAEKPPFSPEWTSFNFYFDPIPAKNSFLEIIPAAYPADNPLGTKLEYANIAVYRVFINKMAFVREPKDALMVPDQIDYKKINPAKYLGEVRGSQGSHVIIFSENYSRDWKLKLTNLDGSKIIYDPPHFSTNLFANAWFIEDLNGDYNFEIYYQPQRMHNYLMVISMITIVGGVALFLQEKMKR